MARPKSKNRGWWSTEEIQFLKDNYNRLLFKDISEILDRPYPSIKGRMRKLGLRCAPKKVSGLVQKRECYACGSHITYIDKKGKARWFFNIDIITRELIHILCNTCWCHFRRKLKTVEEKRESFRKKGEKFSGVNHPMYGRRGVLSPMYGTKMSDEHRKRLSIINKKRMSDPNVREEMRLRRAKQIFPKRDSGIEVAIQNGLRVAGIIFEKNKYLRFSGIHHQVDIFIEPNYVIECDGCYWHRCPDCFPDPSKWSYGQKAKKERDDEVENAFKQQKDFKVIRLWEHDIKADLNNCIERIIMNI